jgi:catechol 2,3-dioxygenase-like lactoylglutathione lyase family enzyme
MDRPPPHAGLRHLALNVRDLDAMKRFYVDLLGFAVEWEPDADNVYLSSGIDNLALHRAAGGHTGPEGGHTGPEGGHTGPPLQGGGVGADVRGGHVGGDVRGGHVGADLRVGPGALDHLGLIVRSADDVDRWAAFLEGRGVPLKARPKTHRDGARSLYFHDPDGNSVQIIHHPPISQKI